MPERGMEKAVGRSAYRLSLAALILLCAVCWVRPAEKRNAAVPEKAAGDHAARRKANRQYPLQPNPLAGCSLCHVDVEDEYVGTKHFKKHVGCKTCHGPSEGHLADENNEVKPDERFARKDVDRRCSECHECDRPKSSQPVSDARGRPKVCIDCHGHHDQKPVAKTKKPAHASSDQPQEDRN